jgi:hypothetical protein
MHISSPGQWILIQQWLPPGLPGRLDQSGSIMAVAGEPAESDQPGPDIVGAFLAGLAVNRRHARRLSLC